MTYTLEIRDAASESKVLSIDRVLIVGREDVDVVVADPAISRRHAQVTPTPDGPVVADLGSRNGTFVNDEPVQEPQLLRVGDVIGIGDSTLLVGNVEGSARATIAPQRQPARGDLAPPSGQGIHRPIAVRPALRDLEAVDAGAAVIRFRQGTAGAAAARLVAADAARARQRLAGFGSESWGVKPQICLVDPFHNPNDPNAVVADGCVIDPVNNEIWMVVTPESPPEPLDRALALLFGASFPAASELTPLIEGYGLHVGGAADVDPELRKIDLPPLPAATGELQSAMALSFVRFLLDRSGDQAFRSFLGSAQPGRLDAAASSVYGAGFGQLDAEWRQHLQSAHEAVSLKHFIGLSLQFLRPHVGRQIEIFAYMFVGLAFTLTFPFATRRLFDRAIPSGEFSQVVQLLVVLSVVFVISTLANVRRAYLSAYVSGAVIRDLRLELFGRLQDLDTRWYHRNPKGDVLSRLFTDVGQVESGLSQTVREGVFQALSLVVASVVMLTLDVRLGLIVLISLPLMAFVYRSMGEGARRRSIAVQRATSSLLDAAAENYDAEPVVKMFGLGRHERGRFESISERLFERQRRLVLFGGMFSLSINLIVTVVRLAVLGLGAWLILDGRMTIGTLVAFFGIMGEVVNPVTTLTTLGQELQAASGGLIRVREVLNETPAVRDADGAIALPPVTRELRFDNVTFGYTAGHPVLENVSFVIPAGARAAFVGPSGSGKSTILRLLMRVYDPASGVVAADGHDLRSVTVDSLRSQMGVVFQDSFLFDTTIRENIALGAPWSDAAMIEAAAQAAEVTAFLPNLPSGLDTMVGGRGAQLSGGQRQRVAIARALVRNPRILLLDEATSSLDPRSERQIVDTLNRASAGRTTVAITHRLASVVDYDIIFVLVDGRLVEQGDHRQLLERGGTYAMLWAEQTGEAAAPARFDPVPALAKVPIFSGLSPTELAEVAALAQPRQLVQSERLADDERLLAILARGRAVVYRRGVADELVPVAELVEGDCYGLRALLDEHTSTVLEASEPTMLLVLGDEALTALTARFPTLAEALVRGPSAYAPVGGRVMGRSTLSSVGALPQLRRSDAAEVPAPSPPQRGDR